MKPLRIGIIGEFQSGKSLLINCLLKRPIATIGEGTPTTHTVVNYHYTDKPNEYFIYCKDDGSQLFESIEKLEEFDKDEEISFIDIFIKEDFLKGFVLVDMPGFGANTVDNCVAREALHNIDFALLIASNDKAIGADSNMLKELRLLQNYNIPYYFILNCINIDRWKCSNRQNFDIAEHDYSLLNFYKPMSFPLNENGINIVNLMWYWYSLCRQDDKLIIRDELQYALARYKIHSDAKQKVGLASNFSLINKIFDMDNRAFLELKRDLKEEIEQLKDTICPIGTIQAFAFCNIPNGWLPCDGRSLSITEYPLLYSVIGKIYGSYDSKNFKLPNLQGKFIRGWDNSGKIDKNRKFGSDQGDSIQIHKHDFQASKLIVNHAGGHTHTVFANQEDVQKPSLFSDDISMLKWLNTTGPDTGTTSESGNHTHEIKAPTSPIGLPIKYKQEVRNSEETRPKNIALLFCIRYK